jgi:hypothetical protein
VALDILQHVRKINVLIGGLAICFDPVVKFTAGVVSENWKGSQFACEGLNARLDETVVRPVSESNSRHRARCARPDGPPKAHWRSDSYSLCSRRNAGPDMASAWRRTAGIFQQKVALV